MSNPMAPRCSTMRAFAAKVPCPRSAPVSRARPSAQGFWHRVEPPCLAGVRGGLVARAWHAGERSEARSVPRPPCDRERPPDPGPRPRIVRPSHIRGDAGDQERLARIVVLGIRDRRFRRRASLSRAAVRLVRHSRPVHARALRRERARARPPAAIRRDRAGVESYALRAGAALCRGLAGCRHSIATTSPRRNGA